MTNVTQLETLHPVRSKLSNLEKLAKKKIEAATNYNEAISMVAKHANIDKTVLNQYVTARVRDKLEKFHLRAEQLELLKDL